MNAFARGRMAQHIVHGSALYERTERFMLFTEILSTFVGQAVEDPFREPEVLIPFDIFEDNMLPARAENFLLVAEYLCYAWCTLDTM